MRGVTRIAPPPGHECPGYAGTEKPAEAGSWEIGVFRAGFSRLLVWNVARAFMPGRTGGLCWILALFLAAPALAQPPVTVTLTPANPAVGDRVQATLTLRVPTAGLAADPRFPAWGKTWGEV